MSAPPECIMFSGISNYFALSLVLPPLNKLPVILNDSLRHPELDSEPGFASLDSGSSSE